MKPCKIHAILLAFILIFYTSLLPAEAKHENDSLFSGIKKDLIPPGSDYTFTYGNIEQFSIDLIVYYWLNGRTAAEGRIKSAGAGKKYADYGSILLAALDRGRWSLKNHIDSSGDETKKLFPRGMVLWMTGFASFSEINTIPGIMGPLNYLLGCESIRKGDYKTAARLFARAMAGIPLKEKKNITFNSVMAGLHDLAIGYDALINMEKTGAASLQKDIPALPLLFPDIKKSNPGIHSAIKHMFPDIGMSFKNTIELRKKIKEWIRATANPAFQEGALIFGSPVTEISYMKDGEDNSSAIKIGGATVMLSRNEQIFWISGEKKFMTRRTYSEYRPVTHYLNLNISFSESDMGNNLDFSFSLGTARKFSINWDGLWRMLLDQPGLSMESSGVSRINQVSFTNPFKSYIFDIAVSGGLPSGVAMKALLEDVTHFAFRDLTFGKGAARTDAGKTGTLVSSVPELEYPLPLVLMQRAMLTHIYSSQDKKGDTGTGSGGDISVMKKSFEEISNLSRLSADELSRLAERYEKEGLSKPELAGHLVFSSHVHTRSYRFGDSRRVLEKYFAAREGMENPDQLKFSLFKEYEIDDMYIDTLINLGDLEHAEKFARRKAQQAKVTNNREREFLLDFYISDILVRAGKWEQSVTLLNSVIADGRFSGLNALNRTGEFLKTINNFYSVKNQNAGERYRLKFKPGMGYQGKSYCAPIAVQFILRHYGDYSTSQKNIADAMGTGHEAGGTQLNRITEYFTGKGYMPVPVESMASALNLLKQGVPMLTLLRLPGVNQAHISAVVGYDKKDDTVYLYEPGSKPVFLSMEGAVLAKYQFEFGPIFLAVVPKKKEGEYAWDKTSAAQAIFNYLDQNSLGAESVKLRALLGEIEKKGPDRDREDFLVHHRLRILAELSRRKELSGGDMSLIKSVMEKNNSDPKAYDNHLTQLQIAEIAIQLKDVKSAKTALVKALASDKGLILPHLALADIAYMENDYQETRDELLRALGSLNNDYTGQIDPRAILQKLFQISAKMENYADAIHYLIQHADFTAKDEPYLMLRNAFEQNKDGKILEFMKAFIK